MGTLAASAIIDRAQTILQDTTSVRWLIQELANWFNDAQREIVLYRPETSSVTTQMTLTAGNTKQTIEGATFSPAVTNPMRLLEVIRNFATDGTTVGRAVRLVAREIMDSQNPSWHGDTAAAEVKHYLFDARDPKTFYVWPKPSGASKLEMIISKAPTEITVSNGAAVGNIALDDIYANAVLDYILYRAYMKDSEYAGNAQRAAAHYAAFANSLGVRIASEKAVSPVMNTVFNPNNPIAVTGGGAAAA